MERGRTRTANSNQPYITMLSSDTGGAGQVGCCLGTGWTSASKELDYLVFTLFFLFPLFLSYFTVLMLTYEFLCSVSSLSHPAGGAVNEQLCGAVLPVMLNHK